MTQEQREEQRALKIAKLIIDNGIVSITGDFNRALRYDECIQKLADHIDDHYSGWQGEEAFLFEIKDLPTDCGFEENKEYVLSEMKFYLVEDEDEIENLGVKILEEYVQDSELLWEYPKHWIKDVAYRFTKNTDEEESFDNFLQDLKDNHFPRYSGHEKYPSYPTFYYGYQKGFEESYEDCIKEKVDKILLPFSADTKNQLIGSLELGIYVEHILDYVPRILPNYDFDNHICDIHPKWQKIIDLLNKGSIEDFRQGLTFIQSLSDIDVAEDDDEYLEAYCMAEYIQKHFMNDPDSSYLTLNDLTYNDLDYGDEDNFYEFLVENVDEYGNPTYHFDMEMVFDYFGGVDYKEFASYESQFKDLGELFFADRYDDDGSPDKYRELAWLMWG